MINCENATYFRYIDEVLIYPHNENLLDIIKKLNKVEPTIELTHALEIDKSLPFFDIFLIRNNNKIDFKMYCKSINKKKKINDLIQFCSLPQPKSKIRCNLRILPQSPYDM